MSNIQRFTAREGDIFKRAWWAALEWAFRRSYPERCRLFHFDSDRNAMRREIRKAERELTRPETCKWVYDEWADIYETECGAIYCFDDGGTLAENNYIGCPNCMRRIEETR